MMVDRRRIPNGLARRPGKQGAGLEGWPNQALQNHVYWLKKKNVKKQKKFKVKKTTPQEQTKKDNPTFNIFQANVSGLNKKRVDLQKLFHEQNVHVALLQETQHQSCNTNISGFTPYTCKCGDCRGIVTYVRNDLQCDITQHTEDNPNDILLATVWFGLRKFKIYNIYSPPKVDFSFSTEEYIFKSTILFGDFNGHSPLWGYKDHNPSGLNIEQLCNSSN